MQIEALGKKKPKPKQPLAPPAGTAVPPALLTPEVKTVALIAAAAVGAAVLFWYLRKGK